MRGWRVVGAGAMILLFSWALAQAWQTAKSPGFIVQTASSPDRALLPQVFALLQQARRELVLAGLSPPQTVTVIIHPNLPSYTATTQQPWFILAVSDRRANTIHTQRLRILLERGSLERTLRHELFHLSQPEGWPRWRAEGAAMRFAGDRPTAAPFPTIREAELNRLLAQPPSSEALARAMATAYLWAQRPPPISQRGASPSGIR
ncbi:MAG: hypothetical protein K6T57_01610 [Thermaceae bacterium]|nr:hypothetical protein [Thermaceae bacterium]